MRLSAAIKILIAFLLMGYVWLHLRGSQKPHESTASKPTATVQKTPKNAPPKNVTNLQNNLPAYARGLNSAYGKFQTGDYAAAILLLREHLIKNPTDEQAKKNLATSCFALALQRIKEQRFQDAGTLLEEATLLGHPQAAAALARLRARSGEIAAATSVLEDIFWKNKDINAAWALVDLALSRDDLALANAYINRAEGLIEAMPENADAAKKILEEKRSKFQMRSSFARNENVLEQGNIQVAYLSPEKRSTAQAVLETMLQSEENFSQTFAPVLDTTRFRALIVPSQDFSNSTSAPAWASAIYDGIIRLSVANGTQNPQEIPRVTIVARHEMLHAHLSALCGDIVPSWLGEGLAQQAEGRPLLQSTSALRMKFGTKLPSNLDSDAWFDKDFYEAPPDVVKELYARSHMLVEAIQRSHSPQIWSTLVTKICVNKEPFSQVLTNEIGASTASELWKDKNAELSKMMVSRK